MKSNEPKVTLRRHERRTSAMLEDLSTCAKTLSALTSLDSVSLGANYLSSLVLKDNHQGQYHQGRKRPSDYTSQLVHPSGVRRHAQLGGLHGDGQAPRCPGEVPFAETALIIPPKPVGEFDHPNNYLLELHLYTNGTYLRQCLQSNSQ